MDLSELPIDLVSLSAHKIYGPKGIGVLYVRKSIRSKVAPLFLGGGHEKGLRSGTLNVPAIVGMGKACEIAGEEMVSENRRVSGLRNRLYEKIVAGLEEVHLNGPPLKERLAQNLNLSFAFVKAEALMMEMKEVALSSGSACTSASPHPSHVIKALGLRDEEVRSSIRFGLGRFNSQEEVDYVAEKVVETVKKIRDASPEYQRSREFSSKEPLIKSF